MWEIPHAKSVEIIAEVGCNHCGNIKSALKYIDVAKTIGADVVKFQVFFAQNLVNPGDILDFCKESQLHFADMLILTEHAKNQKMRLLFSAFCIDSLRALGALGVDAIKVPSGQIFNRNYLAFLGRMEKKVYLSTGMCTMDDVVKAYETLVENGTRPEDITIMQCTTAYPAPLEAANLAVIASYIVKFAGCRIGYSDHTEGSISAVGAAILGARVIEKHIILDYDQETPDKLVSVDPVDFEYYIQDIRNAVKCIGDLEKRPQPCEAEMFHRRDLGHSESQNERRTGN